ncbi:MAG: hypothetical protein EA404_11920 [Spirochaetaceae bacterium]|nr:MAG: hypothetical protein EA404_11920 [Spirochaetaceae bacterium]
MAGERKRRYQPVNRFGWAWKITTFAIPVVLMYPGFLDAAEMQSSVRLAVEQAKRNPLTQESGAQTEQVAKPVISGDLRRSAHPLQP